MKRLSRRRFLKRSILGIGGAAIMDTALSKGASAIFNKT